MPDKDDYADKFGMDGHSERGNDYGGEHHTVYNDVTRISWDTDSQGNHVQDSQGRDSYHETPCNDTQVGKK